jgi:glyoxylase I family protein
MDRAQAERGMTTTLDLNQDVSLTAVERWSFIAYDLEATHRFYTQVLLRPLVYAQTSDYLPGTNDYAPHIEVRYGLDDGSTINLIVFDREPPDAARRLHPLRHFAFDVKDVDTLHRWREHLLGCGLEVIGEIDHGVVMSIYFHDPNEIRLELCTSLIEFDAEEERKAQEVYTNWFTLGAAGQQTPIQSHKLTRGVVGAATGE